MNDAPTRTASSSNTLLIVLVIVMAFFTGYLWNKVKTLEQKGVVTGASGGNANTQSPQQAQPNQQPVQQNQQPETKDIKPKKPSPSKDHWRGSKNARYVWIEYSDLECPFCKQIHPNLIKMIAEYNTVAWSYQHLPLPGHPKAVKSAEATECAAEQKGNDGFWEMTDLIFEKMPTMELSDLPDLAASIGLNKTKFQSCLDSGKYAGTVKQQADDGNTLGVRATPTGVIYDMQTGKTKTVEGALPYESLQSELTSFMK